MKEIMTKVPVYVNGYDITLFDVDIDYERCIIRAKVMIDGTEYSAFYDTCNLVLRDKNSKCVELDEGLIADIESALDEYLDI